MGELLQKAWVWSQTPGSEGADEMYGEIYFPMLLLTWVIVFLIGLVICVINRNERHPDAWAAACCGYIPLLAAIAWPLTWGMSVFAIAFGVPLLIIVAVPAGLVTLLLKWLRARSSNPDEG